MKKMTAVLLATIFALWGGIAFAEEILVVVKSGDTLSQISERETGSFRNYPEIALFNGIIDPHEIKVGQKIKIPEFKKNISSQKKVKVKTVNVKSAPLGTRENPAIYSDEEVGDDRFTGTPAEGLKLVGVNLPEGEIRFADEGIEDIPSGTIFQMVSGKDKSKFYRSELSKEMSRVQKLSVLVEGEKVATAYQKPECGNWIGFLKPPPAEDTPDINTGQPSRKVGRPFVYKRPELPPQCRDYELTAGTGLLFGSQAGMRDWWYYAEGMWWDTCWGWGRGIGFYLNGDDGSNDSPYEWDSFGIGPQIGLRYQDFIENDDGTVQPHSFTAKLRLIWAEMSGQNVESTYNMSQEDLLLGLYTEYVRRIEEGLIVGVTFEGWISLWSSIDSSWSGDSPSDRAQIDLKFFVQKRLNDEFQIKAGLGPFYQFWDEEAGIGPFAELRYNEWLMAGVAAKFFFSGDYVFGPYIRAEGGNYLRGEREKRILDEIWAVDENGNRIESEDEVASEEEKDSEKVSESDDDLFENMGMTFVIPSETNV